MDVLSAIGAVKFWCRVRTKSVFGNLLAPGECKSGRFSNWAISKDGHILEGRNRRLSMLCTIPVAECYVNVTYKLVNLGRRGWRGENWRILCGEQDDSHNNKNRRWTRWSDIRVQVFIHQGQSLACHCSCTSATQGIKLIRAMPSHCSNSLYILADILLFLCIGWEQWWGARSSFEKVSVQSHITHGLVSS